MNSDEKGSFDSNSLELDSFEGKGSFFSNAGGFNELSGIGSEERSLDQAFVVESDIEEAKEEAKEETEEKQKEPMQPPKLDAETEFVGNQIPVLESVAVKDGWICRPCMDKDAMKCFLL